MSILKCRTDFPVGVGLEGLGSPRRDDRCYRGQLNYLTLIGSIDVLHRLYGDRPLR